MPDKIINFKQAVTDVLCEVRALLFTKNEEYGNSISNPIRIFSLESSALPGLDTRIDDKLSRIRCAVKLGLKNSLDESIIDLIGYLVIRKAITDHQDKVEMS